MTLQQMVEDIQTVFPDYGWTHIVLELNRAYTEFCRLTGLNIAETDLSAFSNWSTRTDNSYTIYYITLGSDVDTIMNMSLRDSSDNILYNYTINYEIKRSKVLEVVPVNNTTLPDTAYLHITYRKIPTALSSTTDTIAIDDIYSAALVDKVLSKFWARKGILQNAGWHRSEYKTWLKEGRLRAKSFFDNTEITIQSKMPYDN